MDFHDRTGAFCRLRPVAAEDLPALQAIYRWHVLHGAASFEETPPDLAEFSARFAAIRSRGLPYVCVEAVTGAEQGPNQGLAQAAAGDAPAWRIAGYAYAGPYRPRSAYRFTVENSIYLDPAFAGRGIGRRLLERLIADCEELGMRQMVAVIGDSDNVASIALHRTLGFRQVGVLTNVGFKFGRWVDSVLMQRNLQQRDLVQPDPGGGTDPA